MAIIEEKELLLNSLSQEERDIALKILKEFGEEGKSKLYNNLLYDDFKEIPVDIETFIKDDRYLGNAWKDSKGNLKLYPFWLETLKDIFPDNVTTNYDTLLESGARGIGKSEIACGVICPYLMHRIMCMKDPKEYFHIKSTENIVFAFLNIKLDLAEGIAKEKFQKTIQKSQWFMSKGTMTKRDNSPYWNPPEPIKIVIGSQPDDVIGLPVYFCLDGDTIIKTSEGNKKLVDLVDKEIQVYTIDENGNETLSESCCVKPTLKTNEEYQIELEDGSIIKCTPNHRFMLKDGSYKEARDLIEEDELFSINTNTTIKSIKRVILDEPKQYYDVINANPYNNFLVKTNDSYICSHNCFVDEISFIKNKDVEEQKIKAKNMIDTAKGGMKTRFIYKGKNPTLLCVASSKRSEQSFMETYIRDLSKDENVIVVDKPVWEVKPQGTYSNEIFYVGLGNKFLENLVIPRSDYDNLQAYKERGYKLIEVPIDFEKDARLNLERVLCDYAGISSFSSNKFLSALRLNDAILDTIHNPFPDTIKCGNAKEDTSQYKDWFDINKLDKRYIDKPLFVHLDMSVSGDKTGIAGSWILGKASRDDGTIINDLVFQPAFSTSVEAPTGRQISFAKTREFIRWLRNDLGLKLKLISYDTFQSYDTGQQLQSEGYKTEILSVDRVEVPTGEKVGICKPYQYFKNALYEGRIRLYRTELLYEELVQLEINNTNGKIDHPENGKYGSKDQADALVGSIYMASKYADEYYHDYGENLEQILTLNTESEENRRTQITLDFEEELKNMGPIIRNNTDIFNGTYFDNDIIII